MPGELGDELTQPGVGYYEHLYRPTGDWMESSYGKVQENEPDSNTQMGRLLKRLRKKKKKLDKVIPEQDI